MTETQFQIKSINPTVATGGTITTDGLFTVHTFLTSGTFEITQGTPDLEFLVIAGGGAGGGGSSGGSGGGAGGYRTATGLVRGVGSYTVTVGAGGTGSNIAGTNGADSVFDTITSIGGGGGITDATGAGQDGGSGGGGTGNTAAGLGTVGQGNDGGIGLTNDPRIPHGGGGGAGAVGEDAPDIDSGGDGGVGLSSEIQETGTPVFRAGGGGGALVRTAGNLGLGGTGGGGNASYTAGVAGTANTGGGGGADGGNDGGTGGNGGSGIVILRYLTVEASDIRILRTINVADLTLDAWNFIRFNGLNTQSITIEGSSGNSLVMAANELAVQLEADPPLTTLHGQFTINGTNANLALNGGDPTSSVIDDPIVNTITGNNVATPNDPPPNASIMWTEAIDSDNDAVFAKVRVDDVYTTVQLAPAIATTTFQPAYQFAVDIDDVAVETIPNVWRLPIDFATLSSMTAYFETAPTGSNVTILIKKGGVTEATIVVADGNKTGNTSTFNTGSILTTDEITVEITTIGSTLAGSNLKLSIIDGAQSSTKSIQFAATDVGADLSVQTIADVWRTPTLITTITEVNAYVEIAPVGSAIILLVKKDGVTEATVTIADGAFTGSTAVLTSGTIDFTNEITVEITQVGSGTAGQNLKVNILGI